MKSHKAVGALLALLFLLAASGAALEPMRILVALEAKGSADAAALRASLEAAVAAAPLARLVLRFEPGQSTVVDEAARLACPMALAVEATPSTASLRVSWRYLSSAGGAVLGSGSFVKANPAERDLVSSFWTEVAQDLEKAAASLPTGDSVTIVAPPGARIEGFGESFTMPAEGETVIPLSLPAFVSWKASSRSKLDASGEAYVEAPGERVELTMRSPPSWTAELSLYGFSFPEARIAYLLGKRLFARAGITEFLGGLNLLKYNGPPPAPSIISHYSLLQAGVGFGSYFQDPDREFRYYAAVEAFLRIDLPGYRAVFVDPISPVGLVPLIGAEWGRGRGARLYLELGAIVYPFAKVELMLASQGHGTGDLVFSGAGWVGEFPLPRLGWRLYL